MNHYILILSCPDRPGIVHAVSGFLVQQQCNITDSAQFSDESTAHFFMRVHFSAPPNLSLPTLQADFQTVATNLSMHWQLHDAARKPRVVILVSRFGHCLNDLLFRYKSGLLAIEIPAIISNHRDFEELANAYRIPFHYLPVIPGDADAQEDALFSLLQATHTELVVLARYMQILSPDLCAKLAGRAINIHHSFLPSFKGAKPYHQAYDRGVKLIGATAHYVTRDLDDGPIIEQEVARVDHSYSAGDLTHAGQEVECIALARAVQWHCEHRVLLNGNKTVVFR